VSIPAEDRITTTVTVAAKTKPTNNIENHNHPTANPPLNVQSTDADLEYKYIGTLRTQDVEDIAAAVLVADQSSAPVHLTCASTPSFLVVTFPRTYLVGSLLGGTQKGKALVPGLLMSSATTKGFQTTTKSLFFIQLPVQICNVS
jgi:hypothetical protein